jgi:hypothetical protein
MVKFLVRILRLETPRQGLFIREIASISDQIKIQDFLTSDFMIQTTPSDPSSALAGN